MPTLLDFHMYPDNENGFRLEVFDRGHSRPLAASTCTRDGAGAPDFSGPLSRPGQGEPWKHIDKARDVGVALYRNVIPPGIERVLRDYKNKSDFLTIRIRIAREAEALEAAPWETMHDGEEFLAAGAKTGIVRLPLDIEPHGELPALPLPVRMLSIASNPIELSEEEDLSIVNELEILLQATDSSAERGLLEIEMEEDAGLKVIEGCLTEGFQILHYAGYGAAAEDGGGLLLHAAGGRMRPTSIDRFLQLFPTDRKDIRLVVLPGCPGARALTGENVGELSRMLARREAPAVLAMQFPMMDRAARAFFDVLYPHLLEGLPAAMAVSESRRALLRAEDPRIQADAFAPTLICGADVLFNTTSARPGPRAGTKKRERNVHLHLPEPLFGFRGRRRECRALEEALVRGDAGAVLLHGRIGIGKTALAARTADRIKDHFDGVYAFDSRVAGLAPDIILLELNRFLSKLGNPILEPLVRRYLPPAHLAALLAQALGEARLLILFTNFESRLVRQKDRWEVADDDLRLFLATLIRTAAPGCRFLFTTTHRFSIGDQRAGRFRHLPLDSMNWPESLGLMQKLPNFSGATYAEKMRFFKDIGRTPQFLMIMGGARGSVSIADILEQAGELVEKPGGAFARQTPTPLPSGPAGHLLGILSVFRAPVPRDAAYWMMGAHIDYPASAPSEINREEPPEEGRISTDDDFLRDFRALPSERLRIDAVDELIEELIQYGALNRIEENGEERTLSVRGEFRTSRGSFPEEDKYKIDRGNAIAYYAHREQNLRRDRETGRMDMAAIELFELAFEAGRFEDAAVALVIVSPRFRDPGAWRFIESLIDRLLPKVERRTRAGLIQESGAIQREVGDYDKALSLYEKSLAIFEEINDLPRMAEVLRGIASLHQERGDDPAAAACCERTLEILTELGDRAGMAELMREIGFFHLNFGDHGKALEMAEKSLEIGKAAGDRAEAPRTLALIAMVHGKRGDHAAAQEVWKQSRKRYGEIGDRIGELQALSAMGLIHEDLGDHEAALALYNQSMEIVEERDAPSEKAHLSSNIGLCHQHLGDYRAGLEWFEKSLELFEMIGDGAGVAKSLFQIGLSHRFLEDYPAALVQFEASLKRFEDYGDLASVGRAMHEASKMHRKLDAHLKALEMQEKSLEILKKTGPRQKEASSLHHLCLLHHELGDHKEALKWGEKSLGISEEIDDRAAMARLWTLTGRIHDKRGDYSVAIEHYEKSKGLYEEIGDRKMTSVLLQVIGGVHARLGDDSSVVERIEASLGICREIGDQAGIAHNLQKLGAIAQKAGNFKQALTRYKKALKILKKTGNRKAEAKTLNNMAMMYEEQGKSKAALKFCKKSLAIKREVSPPKAVADSLNNMGVFQRSLRRYKSAIRSYEESLAIRIKSGDGVEAMSALYRIGDLYEQLNDYETAFEKHLTALLLAQDLASPSDMSFLGERLKKLRVKWGRERFDSAWREKMSGGFPEWLT